MLYFIFLSLVFYLREYVDGTGNFTFSIQEYVVFHIIAFYDCPRECGSMGLSLARIILMNKMMIRFVLVVLLCRPIMSEHSSAESTKLRLRMSSLNSHMSSDNNYQQQSEFIHSQMVSVSDAHAYICMYN